jgi:UDP-glucose 4-epimerase
MTVLVTGGGGYIGSHVALELLDNGIELVILDDLSTGYSGAVPREAKFVVGDCGDKALLSRLIKDYGIESIVHFAAKTVVPESVADPLYYYLHNTIKSRNLIEVAAETGVKWLVFSSTAAVYGHANMAPISEDQIPSPINAYGRSKLMTEWMLEDAARALGITYVALRYFNVAGADPTGRAGQCSPRSTHLIKVAVQSALGLRPFLPVFGVDFPTPDGSCVRDFIQVTDLSQVHVAALKHLSEGGDSLVLNCGYGHGFSVLQVIEAVRRVSGIDFEVRIAPRREGDAASVVANPARVLERLKWRPCYDNLDVIVEQALRWERALYDRTSSREFAQRG